jgi:predicted transcriptional regulator
MPSDAIISIRPKFAEAILAGQKSVELRRRIPSLEIGTRLWIYATRPTAAVIGSVVVEEVHRSSPAKIWKSFAKEAAITKSEYELYFEGSSEAVAILLQDAARTSPVHIDVLRDIWEGFHPPQVLHFVPTRKIETLSKFIASVSLRS